MKPCTKCDQPRANRKTSFCRYHYNEYYREYQRRRNGHNPRLIVEDDEYREMILERIEAMQQSADHEPAYPSDYEYETEPWNEPLEIHRADLIAEYI